MLQQTQVVTVLAYFQRFIEKFPNIQSLAAASEDDVFALWSGLGYYTRARNLHRCAKTIQEKWQGNFPNNAKDLETLPGIGRSTAGAISAFCFSERSPILDANVRRVLTRVLAFDGDLASVKNERVLWDYATQLCPTSNLESSMPGYTQGMMDLGASICLPRAPKCLLCPVQAACKASQLGTSQNYPVRTRKVKRGSQSWWLLLAIDQKNRIRLQRRPSTGIWANLYSPEVFASSQDLEKNAKDQWPGIEKYNYQYLPSFLHVLTHRDLHIHPVIIHLDNHESLKTTNKKEFFWIFFSDIEKLGLPAPIRKLLKSLNFK